VLISFLVILLINWYASHSQGYRRKSGKRQRGDKAASGQALEDEQTALDGRQSALEDEQT
jgi:hypothetical protein